MKSERRRKGNNLTMTSLTSPNRGRCKGMAGHTPLAMITIQKKGGE
jgi:hypothetical protein